MRSNSQGFSLIELLIVVAVIGILAVLLIPNLISAVNKAKQKKTMNDIITIATACTDYVTDHFFAPDSGNQSGEVQPQSNFVVALVPFYIEPCPMIDHWGNRYRAYTGTACATVYDVPTENIGEDNFIIASYGRDGVDDGWVYELSQPEGDFYTMQSNQDFRKDLVNWDGGWIYAPLVARPKSGS